MKSLGNIFFAVSIFARRNTPKTLIKRLQSDWSNDVVSLSPTRILPIMVVESALSRPSKEIESLDRWTYLGRGLSPRIAGRRITISSPCCRWKISPPQKIRPTKKAWYSNKNSSDLNNRIWEDRKFSNLMALPKKWEEIYSHKTMTITRRWWQT